VAATSVASANFQNSLLIELTEVVAYCVLAFQLPLPPELQVIVRVLEERNVQWAIMKSPTVNPVGFVITILRLLAPGLNPTDLNIMS